jgi:hypothetical protein
MFGAEACPLSQLIGVNEVIKQAVGIIQMELGRATSIVGSYRVLPLLCSRLARGGKSTTLCLIFDELKKQNVQPIFISFNGSTKFRPRRGESQCAAILRVIALEFVDIGDLDSRSLTCNERNLDRYIGEDHPVVLIIDELNALAAPIDEDAGRMLRELFLDKPNRYLLFSSHIPLSFDPPVSCSYSPPSMRGCHVLGFSSCVDIHALRAMSPGCSSLSPSEVTLFGGIPSLIYSVKALGERKPILRFEDRFPPGSLGTDVDLFQQFVASALDGRRRPKLRCFDEFGIYDQEEHMRWPLCYIDCILSAFTLSNYTEFISGHINDLWTSAGTVESGMDLECVIHIAIAFRCLHCLLLCEGGNIFDRVLSWRGIMVPDEYHTLDSIRGYVSSLTTPANTIIFLVPSYAKCPDFDGIILSGGLTCEYQIKLGGGHPEKNPPEGIIQGYLFRGQSARVQSSKPGWNHLSSDDIASLLGYSLRPLVPSSWPVISSGGDCVG